MSKLDKLKDDMIKKLYFISKIRENDTDKLESEYRKQNAILRREIKTLIAHIDYIQSGKLTQAEKKSAKGILPGMLKEQKRINEEMPDFETANINKSEFENWWKIRTTIAKVVN